MSVPSPFLINSLSIFFCLLLIKPSASDLKCFLLLNSKKLPSMKLKLKSAIGVD